LAAQNAEEFAQIEIARRAFLFPGTLWKMFLGKPAEAEAPRSHGLMRLFLRVVGLRCHFEVMHEIVYQTLLPIQPEIGFES
jgi:hypothetical protein